MVRTSVAVVVVAWGALSFSGSGALRRDPGCGGADEPSSGANAPCTRTKDCSRDLVCAQGVCTEPDAGLALPDAGRDASSTGDASSDGG